jgi:hypothetical protein
MSDFQWNIPQILKITLKIKLQQFSRHLEGSLNTNMVLHKPSQHDYSFDYFRVCSLAHTIKCVRHLQPKHIVVV